MRTPPGWLLSAAALVALAHAPAASGAEPFRPAAAPLLAARPGPPSPGAGDSAMGERAAQRAPGEPRHERDDHVELLSPRPAIPLVAGTTAVLQWEPLAGLAGLPAREEWEAFLSLDGGKSYAFRITPHLDSDLQRTLWEVPGIPSADVRLLLRFGDERRETAIELPQRFTITAAPGPFLALAPRAGLARGRGEAARPEDTGVAAWTEGSRRGAGRRQVVAADTALSDGVRPPDTARGPAALTVRPVKTGPPAPSREPVKSAPRGGGAPAARERQAPTPPIDVSLLTCRLNE